MQGWANSDYANNGFALTASETASSGWKRFYSSEYATSSRRPSLVLSYHHVPKTPGALSMAGRNSAGWVRSTTPSLSTTVTDLDGGDVAAQFGVATTSTFSALTWSASSIVTSGSPANATTSALAQGTQYYARVRAAQSAPGPSTEYSAYSPTLAFRVDNVPPAVSVLCTGLPEDAFTDPAPTSNVACTASATDATSGVSTFTSVTLDGGTAGVLSLTGTGASRTFSLDKAKLTKGGHELLVTVSDTAGNATVRPYRFGIGSAYLSMPADAQSTSSGSITLEVTAPAGTGAQFQYSTDRTSWTTIPAANLSTLAGGPVSTPVALTADGGLVRSTPVSWDMTSAFSNDVVVFVRPCVVPTVGAACTPSTTGVTTVTVDRSGAGAAGTTVGPVSVALTTGAASLGAVDASVGAASVGRSYNSFASDLDGPFGKGWTTSLQSAAGTAWTTLTDNGDSVLLYASEGGDPLGFASATAATGCVMTYTPPADATHLTLCKVDTTTFTLTELDGPVTEFTQVSGPDFTVATVTDPDTDESTTFDATGASITRILAPLPPGVDAGDCPAGSATAWVVGCADLLLTYSSARVAAVTWRGFEQPLDGSSPILRDYDVACYRYDANGHLTTVWDPRENTSGYATCGTGTAPSGALVTGYGYDATTGRLTTITPAGLRPWTISYGTTTPVTGKVTSVSRTHGSGFNSGATETTTIQYGVTIGTASSSSDDTHPDLTASAVAGWWPLDPGQYPVVAPVTATAVFPPGASTSSLKDASITAMDDLGRAVMTAAFSGTGQTGWRISTQVLDPDTGMTVATLTPANRAAALDPASDTRVLLNLTGTSSEAAQMLASITVSQNLVDDNGDGLENGDDIADVTDTYGPLHMIDANGDPVAARTHTHISYGDVATDAAIPSGAAAETSARWHQQLTVTEGGWDPATSADIAGTVDTVQYAYAFTAAGVQNTSGWEFSTPTQVTTVVPGGTDIVSRTVLDSATGAMVQQRQPSAKDDNLATPTNAGTHVTSTWTVGAYNASTCTATAWFGLPCKAGPASGTVPATTQTSYDVFARPVRTIDTGNSATRTTQVTHLNSGLSTRPATNTITGGASGDKAVPDKSYAYNSTTGIPTRHRRERRKRRHRNHELRRLRPPHLRRRRLPGRRHRGVRRHDRPPGHHHPRPERHQRRHQHLHVQQHHRTTRTTDQRHPQHRGDRDRDL